MHLCSSSLSAAGQTGRREKADLTPVLCCEPDMSCWLCGEAADLCPHCGLVSSCAPHLPLHRHNNTCRPFTVRRTEALGRHLVAARTILPLETILVEEAWCVGPCRDTHHLVCVECLTLLHQVDLQCPLCLLPVCSVQCLSGPHHQLECRHIQEKGEGWRQDLDQDRLAALLAALTTIRMLLKKKALEKDKSFVPELFDLSVSNGEIPEIEEKVTEEVRTLFGGDIDMTEFQRCYDQLFINGKSLCEIPGTRGTGLYLLYSIMNHSCVPNTCTILTTQTSLQVKAQTKILAGEEITARYGGLNLGQPRRSQLLSDHWRFSCSCPRCSDPTERGTFNSAVLCPVRECGELGSSYLCQYRALLWRCTSCAGTQPLEFVLKVIRDAESFIKNNVGCDVETEVLERTIWSLELTLHPRHYLLAQVKLVLLSKYSFLPAMSQPVLERVVQLGEELLLLSLALDTVYSVMVGTVLKVLIPAWSRLSERHRTEGSISVSQYKHRKTKTYGYVDMIINCNKMRRTDKK